MPQKQKKRAKNTAASAGESTGSRTQFFDRFRSARDASVAEYRNDLVSQHTLGDAQLDFTECLNRWCGTFPAPLAAYAQNLIETGSTNEEITRELAQVCDELKPEPKNWIGLACDGELPKPDWLAPAYLAGWPGKPEATRRHIPVVMLQGRLAANDTTRIIEAVTREFEEKLALAKTAAINYAERWRAEQERIRIKSLFQHSRDYRSITYKGRKFELTSFQADIVKRLHEAYLNGTPELSQTYILTEMDSETGNRGERLRDYFKRTNSELWGNSALIIPGATKGSVRLNLPSADGIRNSND